MLSSMYIDRMVYKVARYINIYSQFGGAYINKGWEKITEYFMSCIMIGSPLIIIVSETFYKHSSLLYLTSPTVIFAAY